MYQALWEVLSYFQENSKTLTKKLAAIIKDLVLWSLERQQSLITIPFDVYQWVLEKRTESPHISRLEDAVTYKFTIKDYLLLKCEILILAKISNEIQLSTMMIDSIRSLMLKILLTALSSKKNEHPKEVECIPVGHFDTVSENVEEPHFGFLAEVVSFCIKMKGDNKFMEELITVFQHDFRIVLVYLAKVYYFCYYYFHILL